MNWQALASLTAALTAATASAAPWPAAQSPAIPEASGFVVIPQVAVPPVKERTYKAIFDATRAAEQPAQLLPALDMAGSELNALAVSGIPLAQAKFVVVFHGPAIDGILDDASYRAKYGIGNPNLAVLRRFKAAGVELFVCGQNLAFDKRDPHTIAPEVTVASDALLVLMQYQNTGYALLSF